MGALAEHLGRVRRHVAHLIRGRCDSIDDCVQEVMLEACRSVDRHGPPQYPKKWLSTITERVVYRNLRAERRRVAAEGALEHHGNSTSGAVLDSLAKVEEESRLREVLGSLPERDRSAINKYYWRGMSCPEIGRDAGTTGAAIKTRLHRSRIELFRRLADADGASRGR